MPKMPNFGGGDNLALRHNLPLWIIRLVQLFVAFIVLGVTASNASDFKDLGCGTPSKLGYNIACAVITILALLYLIPSTGPKAITAIPSHPFIQLGLTAFLLILWIAATGASTYGCDDICNACSKADTGCGLDIWTGGLYCSCLYSNDNSYTCVFDKRSVLEKASVSMELRARAVSSGGGKTAFNASKLAAKQAFDAIELLLFLAALALTIFLIIKGRRASSTGTAHPAGQSMQQQPYPPAGGNNELHGPAPQQYGGPPQAGQYNQAPNKGQYGGAAQSGSYGVPPPAQYGSPSHGEQYNPTAPGNAAGSYTYPSPDRVVASEPSTASYNYPPPSGAQTEVVGEGAPMHHSSHGPV